MVAWFLAAGIVLHDPTDRTPAIIKAAEGGSLERIDLLLAHGASLDERDVADDTALHTAANWEQVDLLRALLARGASPNTINNKNWTPLTQAVNKHKEAVFDALLRGGADPNLAGCTASPLVFAIENHNVLQRLLSAGAGPNRGGKYPYLRTAVSKKNAAAIRALLAHDAVDRPDDHGWTASMVASLSGDAECIAAFGGDGVDQHLVQCQALVHAANRRDVPSAVTVSEGPAIFGPSGAWMRRRFGAVVLVAVGFGSLACSGLWGGKPSDLDTELAALEGSQLEADEEEQLQSLVFEGGGEQPKIDAGSGVQILHVSPYGTQQKAIQAAVVFDRPMVSMTDLDTMTGSVPLSCSPDVGAKARWAGSSTAVIIPKGAFPRATGFECTVPAGIAAIDGVTLEKAVTWTFETVRPRVVQTVPRDGKDGVDPAVPIRIEFDQPVVPDGVLPHLLLKGPDGKAVKFEVRPVADRNNSVEVVAKLEKAKTYTLRVNEGVVGTEGPLPLIQPMQFAFTTYGPLALENFSPEGDDTNPGEALYVSFTNPVSRDEVAKRLTITPTPDGWSPPTGEYAYSRYSLRVSLLPRTTYTVKLAAGVTDTYGQKLAEGKEWSFTTGDYDPWVVGPSGLAIYAANNPKDLPFKHLNASRVDVLAASVDPGAFRPAWNKLVAAMVEGGGKRSLPVVVDPAPNVIELDSVDLSGLLNSSGLGWVATRFSAPNVLDWNDEIRKVDSLFVITDMGVTMKVGAGGTDLWVTSLSKAAPVADAKVTLYFGEVRAAEVTTDKDGLARVDGFPKPGWNNYQEPAWALVRKGEDVSLANARWDDGLEAWRFGFYGGNGVGEGPQVSSFGFADRGVYRLGDPVHARATFRLKSAKGLELPSGSVSWTLSGPDGDELEKGEGKLDARGGFSVSSALPAEGSLGEYAVAISANGDGWASSAYVSVPARAYRPPAFRVEVLGPPMGIMGQTLQAVAHPRYLFGGALNKAAVHWRAYTDDDTFAPDAYENWSFQQERNWWEEDDAPSGYAFLGEHRGTVTDGASTFAQTVEAGFRKGPVRLTLEAEVTDVDRQAIANRTEIVVHPASFYAGVKPVARLATVGTPTGVEVIALSLAGVPVSQTLEVSVVQREWNSVREKGMDGQWRWVNTVKDTPVSTQTVSTGSKPSTVTFTPTKAGYHLAVAKGKDSAGNVTVAEEGLYVRGTGYVGWGRRDDNQMELVPEKRTWKPGETAKILVKAPAENLRALVTVEREGVLWKKVVALEGTAPVVEIPITDAYRPNVYVSVVAVSGAGPQDAPDKGRPQVYVGLTELKVDTTNERLDVSLVPSLEVYRPRDKVSVDVMVKQNGKPAAGVGVSLYAVDEAVLSLTAYKTPNAFDTFYQSRGLGVLTSDGRTAAVDRAAYLVKGAHRGGGGGMGEGGPEVRSKFLTTITWQPDLKTDAAGKVTATFDLPDNLTTFRIMAVADGGSGAFGAGDKEIRVTRPLIVRPALPRLLRAGDQAYAGVVVHNGVDTARWVKVAAEVTGPVTVVGSPTEIRVEAGGSVEVPFSLKALEPGPVKFTFRASAGEDRDAVEWPLMVERQIVLDTVASAGMTDGSAKERIVRPDGAYDAWGGLTVDVSSTALVGAGSGLSYLRGYAHECIEQKTSRGLGNLMMLRVRDRAGIAVSSEVLTSDVKEVLVDLRRYRVSGGGMSYWTGGDEASVMGTTYAVEFLARAKDAKFDIDEPLLAEEVSFLRDVVSGRRRMIGFDRTDASVVAKAAIASALARAGSGDAGLNNELYGKRQDLSVYGLASLLESIVRTTGKDERSAELERLIAGRSYVEATKASIKENDTTKWARLWGSDDLSTASALEALVVAGSKNPLLPRYASHLTGSKVGERWANTRATAAVLASLAAYADAFEGAVGKDVPVTVLLGGTKLIDKAVPVPGTVSHVVPMKDLKGGELSVDTKGGRVYYEARLAYAPRDPPPRDEGFSVTRKLDILEGGGPEGRILGGATVRVTLNIITPVGRSDVAILDPIPAGFEIVDTSLATSSQARGEDAAEEENLYDLGYADSYEDRTEELPEYGGSWVFDHHEFDDGEVRLYASYMPPGVHTYRYVVRATTPGSYVHPPAAVEEMYRPENFGRTKGGTLTIGGKKE